MPDTGLRDREATERRLVVAAEAVIAAEGFQSFGVNAVARAAGCDKQLIYRYFGGLDGLLEAVGAGLGARLEALLPKPPHGASYAVIAETLILAYAQALRGDDLMRRLTIWELAASSPALAKISAARSRVLARWLAAAKGEASAPDGVDAPAINAALIAAAQIFALAEHANGAFAGLDLTTPSARKRAQGALRTLIRTIYA